MARSYDGSSGYVLTSNGAAFNLLTAWTAATWALFNTTAGNSCLMTHQNIGASIPLVLALGNGGGEGSTGILFAGFYNGAWRNAGNDVPVTGRWMHVCGVWDGTDISLWVDGVLKHRNTRGSGTPTGAGGGADFRLGVHWDGGVFTNGRMEKGAVWNVGLQAHEILELSRGIDPKSIRPGSLVASWPFIGTPIEPDMYPSREPLTAGGTTGPIGGIPAAFVPSAPSLLLSQLNAPEFVGVYLPLKVLGA